MHASVKLKLSCTVFQYDILEYFIREYQSIEFGMLFIDVNTTEKWSGHGLTGLTGSYSPDLNIFMLTHNYIYAYIGF